MPPFTSKLFQVDNQQVRLIGIFDNFFYYSTDSGSGSKGREVHSYYRIYVGSYAALSEGAELLNTTDEEFLRVDTSSFVSAAYNAREGAIELLRYTRPSSHSPQGQLRIVRVDPATYSISAVYKVIFPGSDYPLWMESNFPPEKGTRLYSRPGYDTFMVLNGAVEHRVDPDEGPLDVYTSRVYSLVFNTLNFVAHASEITLPPLAPTIATLKPRLEWGITPDFLYAQIDCCFVAEDSWSRDSGGGGEHSEGRSVEDHNDEVMPTFYSLDETNQLLVYNAPLHTWETFCLDTPDEVICSDAGLLRYCFRSGELRQRYSRGVLSLEQCGMRIGEKRYDQGGRIGRKERLHPFHFLYKMEITSREKRLYRLSRLFPLAYINASLIPNEDTSIFAMFHEGTNLLEVIWTARAFAQPRQLAQIVVHRLGGTVWEQQRLIEQQLSTKSPGCNYADYHGCRLTSAIVSYFAASLVELHFSKREIGELTRRKIAGDGFRPREPAGLSYDEKQERVVNVEKEHEEDRKWLERRWAKWKGEYSNTP